MHGWFTKFDDFGPDELDGSVECSADEVEIVILLLQREVLDHGKQGWQFMSASFHQDVDEAGKELVAAHVSVHILLLLLLNLLLDLCDCAMEGLLTLLVCRVLFVFSFHSGGGLCKI